MERREVVVLGAGPAGTAAAFFLKRGDPDIDVLLLDRLTGDKFTRYHRMCGQAVSRAAFLDLNPIRPTHVLHDISYVRKEWPGGTTLDSWSPGYVMDRPAFLRDVMESYRSYGGEAERGAVHTVIRDGEGTRLYLTDGRTIHARYLIAADGARSVVRESLLMEKPPIMLSMEQYLVRRNVRKDTLTFLQEERYAGVYRWEFPCGDLCCIGFPRGTGTVEEEVVEKHRRVIPTGGVQTIVQNGVYLTGDAAALSNPITNGGMRIAMLSGRKAAEAILKGAPSSYQRWWDRSLFSCVRFMRARRRMERMSDEDLIRASMGLNGHQFSMVYSYLSRREYWDLYNAYLLSLGFGW